MWHGWPFQARAECDSLKTQALLQEELLNAFLGDGLVSWRVSLGFWGSNMGLSWFIMVYLWLSFTSSSKLCSNLAHRVEPFRALSIHLPPQDYCITPQGKPQRRRLGIGKWQVGMWKPPVLWPGLEGHRPGCTGCSTTPCIVNADGPDGVWLVQDGANQVEQEPLFPVDCSNEVLSGNMRKGSKYGKYAMPNRRSIGTLPLPEAGDSAPAKSSALRSRWLGGRERVLGSPAPLDRTMLDQHTETLHAYTIIYSIIQSFFHYHVCNILWFIHFTHGTYN